LLQLVLFAGGERPVQLLEAGRGHLPDPRAVPPGQQPGSPHAQQQLVDEGDHGEQDHQAGKGHEDGELHAASVARHSPEPIPPFHVSSLRHVAI
jgi:hypothetical protein